MGRAGGLEGRTKQFSELTPASSLRGHSCQGLGDHMGLWGWNPGCAVGKVKTLCLTVSLCVIMAEGLIVDFKELFLCSCYRIESFDRQLW